MIIKVKTMQNILILFIMLSLTACFPHKPGMRLAHHNAESPNIGEQAPEFELTDLVGNPLHLNDLLGKKPLIVQIGSHTCPVYRYRRWDMKKLHRQYGDRVNFLVVYTLEAHPFGAINPYVDREWVSSVNYVTNTLVRKHHTNDERLAQATRSKELLNLPYTMAIDSMDNRTWKAYGRAPSTAFVLDKNGKVALKQVWVNPNAMRPVLDRLLKDN